MSFFLSGYLKREVGELRWPGVHSNGDIVMTSLLVPWWALIVYSLYLSYINSTLPKPLEIALTALTLELFASTIGAKGIYLLTLISLSGAGKKMYQNKVEGFKKIHHENKCSLSSSYSLGSGRQPFVTMAQCRRGKSQRTPHSQTVLKNSLSEPQPHRKSIQYHSLLHKQGSERLLELIVQRILTPSRSHREKAGHGWLGIECFS